MHIDTTSQLLNGLNAAKASFERANERLMDATESVAEGNLIDAAMALQEARIAAKAGAAVAKAADEISGTLLDIVA